MTEVRTFKAASMQEALDLVRRELGTEAVILHTRQTSQRKLLPWMKARQVVEITAGLGVNVRPVAARAKAATPGNLNSPAAARPAFAASSARPMPTAARPVPTAPAESETDDDGVELQIRSLAASRSAQPESKPKSQAEAAMSLLLQAAKAGKNATGSSIERNESASGGTPLDATGDLVSRLDSIQKMVENLGRNRSVGVSEIPNELFHLYTDLIDADVEDDLARDLVFRLKQNARPDQLSNTAAAKALLTAMVESEIRCAPPITATRGRRKVVALVGPTGVGKTTTIAKLAANFRLREGIRMGLVTVDTYRIAAVEQLRTYAEIIDLPMKVVTSPLEMRRALDELCGMDLVLIDTAGRSPRDELKIQELKSLLAEADVDEVHLVLSLTGSLRSIQATAEKFSAANTTALVLTKLDEAAGMGALLSVARKVGLPMSYLTTGQDVPDDIEPANASRMARLVLGQDRLFD